MEAKKLGLCGLVGSLMLISPGTVTDTIGMPLVGLMVLVPYSTAKKVSAIND